MSTNEPPPYGDPMIPPPAGYSPVGNKKALWSMIIGIGSLALGLFCGLVIIGSVVAIVLGFIARGEIKNSNGTQTGAGQALTGIVTGIVMLVLFVLAIALFTTGAVEYDFNNTK